MTGSFGAIPSLCRRSPPSRLDRAQIAPYRRRNCFPHPRARVCARARGRAKRPPPAGCGCCKARHGNSGCKAFGDQQDAALHSSRCFEPQPAQQVNTDRYTSQKPGNAAEQTGLWCAELRHVGLETAEQKPEARERDEIGERSDAALHRNRSRFHSFFCGKAVPAAGQGRRRGPPRKPAARNARMRLRRMRLVCGSVIPTTISGRRAENARIHQHSGGDSAHF